MSGRRGFRALAGLLALLCAAVALLGGVAYGLFEEKEALTQRTARLESKLQSAQAALLEEQTLYNQLSVEADALRESAARSEALQQEVALAIQDREAAESAAKLQTSLAAAHSERSSALSDENALLQAQIERLQEQAQANRAEIDLLGALLTECEEEFAGVQALYAETAQALQESRERNDEESEELASVYARLTEVEEDYAGASALLTESDAQIAQAQQEALSYYNSLQVMCQAAEAKQAQIDLLREEIASLQVISAAAFAAGLPTDSLDPEAMPGSAAPAGAQGTTPASQRERAHAALLR